MRYEALIKSIDTAIDKWVKRVNELEDKLWGRR